MDSFLALLFEPIKQWLIQQGAWDTLVGLWDALSRLFDTITNWLGVDAPNGGVADFLVGVLKLSFDILLTIFKVFIDLINWIIGLFG